MIRRGAVGRTRLRMAAIVAGLAVGLMAIASGGGAAAGTKTSGTARNTQENEIGAAPHIRIGSKAFTESIILGEIAAGLAREAGGVVEHRQGLGGTRVVWNALTTGDIDLYVEYTGTIAEEILAGTGASSYSAIGAALAEQGVTMLAPLGFDDTYAIGMKEAEAARLGVRTISDLSRHADLPFGFSNEFLDRADGWPALRDRYRLPQTDVRGLDHDLAYRALDDGTIAASDFYSTDAEIAFYHLRILEDDLKHFPSYRAVLLVRSDLERRAPRVVEALRRMGGAIDARAMIGMNAKAKLDHVPETEVASEFLRTTLGVRATASEERFGRRLARRTVEHLGLVGLSLLVSILIAVPLGILAFRAPRLGQLVLGVSGVLQTIPSLALLAFLIPVLGIGAPPAIVAMILYGLLPIVGSTVTGLREITPALRESAEALGLRSWARLRLIEMPLASRAILAGIKTSAVINVGTATLGALIGAGGYGQPILSGIRLARASLILEGAIPAALMALCVQWLFDGLERLFVPRGLRL